MGITPVSEPTRRKVLWDIRPASLESRAIPRKYILRKSFVFHVLNRGNARRIVFRQPEDYEYFCRLLKRYKNKFHFKIYHWVLIANHFHLEIIMLQNLLMDILMTTFPLKHLAISLN